MTFSGSLTDETTPIPDFVYPAAKKIDAEAKLHRAPSFAVDAASAFMHSREDLMMTNPLRSLMLWALLLVGLADPQTVSAQEQILLLGSAISD